MIKNVIFDIDGVLRNLVNAPLAEILSEPVKAKMPEEFKDMTANEFYRTFCKLSYPPYIDYDKGLLTETEYAEKINKDFGVDKELFNELFNYRCKPDRQIFYEPTFNLIKKLKSEGYKIFILSNMGKALADTLRQLMDISLFDDIVFSCEDHFMKPHKEMYKHAISKFKINPTESVFVDDRESNLVPFAEFGGKTFLFDKHDISGSVSRLEKFIKEN